MLLQIEDAFRRQQLDASEHLRQPVRRHNIDDHGDEPLVQAQDFAELPAAPARLHRRRADQPDDRIGGADEVGELLLPLLAEGKIAAIDGDVEAGDLQGGDELVGDRYLAARIRDENLQTVVRRNRLRSSFPVSPFPKRMMLAKAAEEQEALPAPAKISFSLRPFASGSCCGRFRMLPTDDAPARRGEGFASTVSESQSPLLASTNRDVPAIYSGGLFFLAAGATSCRA